MKSIGGKNHGLKTTTISQVRTYNERFEDLREHAMTLVALGAGITAVVAMYAVMFLALYWWSHHAPLY